MTVCQSSFDKRLRNLHRKFHANKTESIIFYEVIENDS